MAPNGNDASESARFASNRGVRLQGFELIEKVGQGGMGAVYKARQISMDRVVAVKILPKRFSKDQAFLDRFVREARAAGKLNHANIVTAIDAGESNGTYYFAMEYVEGPSALDKLRKDGPFDEKDAVAIGLQLASALQHAHDLKLVHRDIKPANLLLGKGGIAKLTDLGLAKTTTESDGHANKAIGTPGYMSPEQAQAKEDIDIRTDIYGAGATLYHLLTGRPLFSGQAHDILQAQVVSQAPSPLTLRPGLSPYLAAVVEKCLAKDCADRYQEPKDLMADLERFQAGKRPALDPRKSFASSVEPTAAVLEKLGKTFTGKSVRVRTTGKLAVVDLPLPSPAGAPGQAVEAERKVLGLPLGAAVAAGALALGVLGIGAWWVFARGANEPSEPPASASKTAATHVADAKTEGQKTEKSGKAEDPATPKKDPEDVQPAPAAKDPTEAAAAEIEEFLKKNPEALDEARERYEALLGKGPTPRGIGLVNRALAALDEKVLARAHARLAEVDKEAVPLEQAGKFIEAIGTYEKADSASLGLIGRSKLRQRINRVHDLAAKKAEEIKAQAEEMAKQGKAVAAVRYLRDSSAILPPEEAELLKPAMEAMIPALAASVPGEVKARFEKDLQGALALRKGAGFPEALKRLQALSQEPDYLAFLPQVRAEIEATSPGAALVSAAIAGAGKVAPGAPLTLGPARQQVSGKFKSADPKGVVLDSGGKDAAVAFAEMEPEDFLTLAMAGSPEPPAALAHYRTAAQTLLSAAPPQFARAIALLDGAKVVAGAAGDAALTALREKAVEGAKAEVESRAAAALANVRKCFGEGRYEEFEKLCKEVAAGFAATDTVTKAKPELEKMVAEATVREERQKKLLKIGPESARIKAQALKCADAYGKVLWREKNTFEYARLMSRTGNWSGAIAVLQQIPVKPKNPADLHWSLADGTYYYEYAQALRGMGSSRDAKAYLNQVLACGTAKEWAIKDSKEQMEWLDHLPEKQKRAAELRAKRTKGEVLNAAEHWELIDLEWGPLCQKLDARAELEFLVDVFPDAPPVKSGEAPHRLLECLQFYGEHALAAAAAENFRKAYPQHPSTTDGTALWWQAEALYRQQEFKAALPLYQQIATANPQFWAVTGGTSAQRVNECNAALSGKK